jgi:hypothetical protein
MRIFLTILAVFVGTVGASAADVTVKGGETYNRSTITAAPEGNPFAGLYFGGDMGGEANDISLTLDGEDFSGISADGFRGGMHAGYNACVASGCVGVELAYGLADANLHVGPLGDVLEAEDYARALLTGKYRFGNSYVGARAGYEWSAWTVGNEKLGGTRDVDTGWWVIGGEIGTMATAGGVLRLTVDYSVLDDVSVAGIDERAINRALEDTDKLTAKVGFSIYPAIGQSLTSILDR